MGFFDLSRARAEMRELKISRTTETRSTCPYCSVSCGVIIHTLGDKAKNVTPAVVHVEGDPDHPINRGTLCPKGIALKDDITHSSRLKTPKIRRPGSDHWEDIKNADVVLVMGGNPAENHPCGFKWAIEAKKTRNAKIVAVDPRFTRTAAVSDYYAPLRPGTDIAFLSGIIRYAIHSKRFHEEYVKIHTNGPYLVSEKYGFNDGLFSGFDPAKGEYLKDSWAYEPDEKTQSYRVDPTMQHPQCVFQLLKKHVDRYTPEMVEKICGTPKDKFLKVAEIE